MSGHSKWATIKRKKAALDAKRGQAFTRLIKEITIAARQGGGDPDGNPRLRLAIDNAKAANMPADNIERAIKKATGELEGQIFHEVVYEGYGPGGVAVIVEAATDNKNRTVAEIRHIFSKNGGSMGELNSVMWMFERKGIVTVKRNDMNEEDMMELVLEAGADDLQTEEEFFGITTSVDSFETVRKILIDKNLNVESATIQWVANNLITVSGEESEKVQKLIESFEDSEDVQNVYSNADFVE